MLLFFHLFIALSIGIILAIILKNKYSIIFCGLGGLLPDIIDKPLGFIFLSGSLNWGRIYFHTILFVVIIFVIGLILLAASKYSKNPDKTNISKPSCSKKIINRFALKISSVACISIALGMFLHQLGDEMWCSIQNWMWPFMGSFTHAAEYFTPVPDGYEMLLLFAELGVSVATGFIVVYIIHHIIKNLKQFDETKIKHTTQIFVYLIIGILTAIIMFFIIDVIFLSSSNGEYFQAMFLHELISISEWIFGISSLIITIIFTSKHLSLNDAYSRLCFCGAGCILISAIIPILWTFGIQADFVYSENLRYLALVGIVLGAIIMITLGKKVLKYNYDRNIDNKTDD